MVATGAWQERVGSSLLAWLSAWNYSQTLSQTLSQILSQILSQTLSQTLSQEYLPYNNDIYIYIKVTPYIAGSILQ